MTKKYLMPLWLKLAFTAFLAIFVPTYLIFYGPLNFLWFSDISLVLSYLGVMFEIPIYASMAVVGGLILEAIWMIDFFLILFFNIHWVHLADYMFNPDLAIGLRALSCFHFLLLPLYFFMIKRLGYDRRAWYYQSILAWVILMLSWLFTNPARNINWIFNYQNIEWLRDKPGVYMTGLGLLLMSSFAFAHFVCLFMAPKLRAEKKEPS